MNENKEFEHEIDPDLLAEIEEWEKADHDEPAEYYFSNPDPYLKPQPLPSDHPRRNCYFNEDGHLCAKNLSAFWVPELTVTEVIHGTVYRTNLQNIYVVNPIYIFRGDVNKLINIISEAKLIKTFDDKDRIQRKPA